MFLPLAPSPRGSRALAKHIPQKFRLAAITTGIRFKFLRRSDEYSDKEFGTQDSRVVRGGLKPRPISKLRRWVRNHAAY